MNGQCATVALFGKKMVEMEELATDAMDLGWRSQQEVSAESEMKVCPRSLCYSDWPVVHWMGQL